MVLAFFISKERGRDDGRYKVTIAIRELGCPELGQVRCRECPIARAMAEVERMEVAA